MQILSNPIFALDIRESLGSRNMMVTSDFRLEVEIQLFGACVMKNMQYNLYLWLNRQNFCVLK